MTVAAILAGLLPMLWSHGAGAEYMVRIAVPMIGGIVSSTVLTLLVIPTLYTIVSSRALTGAARRPEPHPPAKSAESRQRYLERLS
jgi:Cu(I)/Ag(I) efflux system membrane protein CusA/SilA